ncbi:DUF2156 domain-containing protein, partial [Candidatus Woesearchaeota archaeon]|nr:DUF2156 domain-containing protein [Candidatus Woesearchaeota archaeon]
DLVTGYLEKFPPKISELTFTNLFAWRHRYEFEHAEFKHHLIIRSKNKFYPPVGKEPEKIIREIFEKNKKIKFVRIDEKTAHKLIDDFSVEEQRDMNDYVYEIKKLRELKGSDYEEKRNLINQFEKNNPDVCALSKHTVEEFFHLQRRWCDIRNCQENEGLLSENRAIIQTLKNIDQLNISGICIRVDNEIQGFAIGERLNDDTYVEHFEKGNTEYTGIYQYLLREFAKFIPEKFRYLNREQDLGIPGIRKAKKSYNPAYMVKKYLITE